MRALLMIAAGALLATPAVAGQHDQNPKPAKEKKICRSERPTGSIFDKRICHTSAEWKAIDDANAAGARSMRDRAGFGQSQ